MRRKMVVIVSNVEIELIPKMIVLYTLQKIQENQEKREYNVLITKPLADPPGFARETKLKK